MVDDSGKEGVGEKGDIMVIGRIGGMVRAAGKSIRSSEFASWDMM
jgi:hypothetical protein